MHTLEGKTAVVTGGSRGLGKGIVHSLSTQGAKVWAVARNAKRLEELKSEIPGVETISLDVSDEAAPYKVFDAVQPNLVILCAGATPRMAPVHEQTWEDFSGVWENDVKSTFEFGKSALRMPLKPGSQLLIVSSGAAIGGSFMSGGYAGAKRMQWLLADYFQKEADALGLNIRFKAVLPKQIIGETGLGHQASSGYADRLGITKEEFLKRFPTPLTPQYFGECVTSLILEDSYRDKMAFGVTGSGVELLN